ncbi:RDD family protein, partial [Streptomyces sp. NPDC058701]|uniref:RDD family protein n=1 Tax=Streptomyces sp. NPDC058701 TaxID=3346608 RepID=UPI00366341D5
TAPAVSAPAVSAPAVSAPAVSAPAWPDAPGGSGSGVVSGLTSSWPEASPRAAASAPAAPRPAEAAASPAPAPAPARSATAPPAAPEAPAREEAAPRRANPAAARPAAARPGAAEPASRPAPVRPAAARPAPRVPAAARPAPRVPVAESAAASGWQPRAGGAGPTLPEPEEGARTARGATSRAVFERMAERAARPAGLGRRVVARVLDSLVFGAVAAAVALPLVPTATAHLQAKVDAARAGGRTTTVWLFDTTIATDVGLVLGAVLLFGVFYEVLPTARWGRTPGKKLLGVRVLAVATLRPPTVGAALRRWLVYAFLGLPGSLWCLFDRPRRRGWHDRAAGTYVSR